VCYGSSLIYVRRIASTRRALSALAFAIASLTFAIQSCSSDDTEILPTTDSGSDQASSDSTNDQQQPPASRDAGADSPLIIPGDGAIYLDAGALCTDAGSLTCAPGFVCCTPCCLAGKEPVCLRGQGSQCPLPDLTIDRTALGQGMYFDTFEAGACELEEKCIGDAGMRKVLRFDVRIANRGTADLVLGRPEAGAPGFIFAACHEHFHFDDFATYSLKNDAGSVIVAGRKQAFCARDNQRIDPFASPAPKYTCSVQGISVGWQDIYAPELPCQWLDVTDIAPGIYQLEVEVNPNKVMTELDCTNNKASVQVTLP
jgi:hypothetical protein